MGLYKVGSSCGVPLEQVRHLLVDDKRDPRRRQHADGARYETAVEAVHALMPAGRIARELVRSSTVCQPGGPPRAGSSPARRAAYRQILRTASTGPV